MSYEQTVAKLNAAGWWILNTFQFGDLPRPRWQVNCQRRKRSGATEAIFSEFAQAETLQEAVDMALANCLARDTVDTARTERHTATRKAGQGRIPEALERRLDRAMDNLWATVKLSGGTGSKD